MITSLVINTLTLGTVASGYLFKSLKGFGFPEVNVDIQENGNWHGASLGRYRYGRRILSIEMQIIGTSRSDFETKRRALQQALALDGGLQTVTFTTAGGLNLQFDAILNVTLDDTYTAGNAIMCDARVELVVPFPFFEGQTLSEVNVSVFSGGGFGIPFAIPFDISAGGSNLLTITNNGNGRAYPIIRIYGIIENPSFANETTGESFSINYSLTTLSDYIEIDTFNRTVLYNGVTNFKQYISGDWVALAGGANIVKLSASSSGNGAKAVVSYRDSYLGI